MGIRIIVNKDSYLLLRRFNSLFMTSTGPFKFRGGPGRLDGFLVNRGGTAGRRGDLLFLEGPQFQNGFY